MHGPLKPEEYKKLSVLPAIKRARGHRLYCVDGSRWIDCWADGGRALLGHRPNRISLRLKNEIDKGLYAPYPSPWNKRLERALYKLFPGYQSMRIFNNFDRAIKFTAQNEWPADPLDLPPDMASINGPAWGRPLLSDHPLSPILFPILPLPGIDIQPVLFGSTQKQLPTSDPVSPLLLAALTRACLVVIHIENGIPSFINGTEQWEIRGPYMLWHGSQDDYSGLFDSLTKQSVLIAPVHNRPSILPPDMTQGEKRLMLTYNILSTCIESI